MTVQAQDPRDGMPIFSDWRENGVVYVDGRLARNKARYEACRDADAAGWYRNSIARRVWMVELRGTQAEDATGGEMDVFWQTCDRTHPGAFPMWAIEWRMP